ncbi:MAG: hypothetical protein AAGG75_14335 [Bacteroidota bacterium]
MKLQLISSITIALLFSACIGDDIIMDTVEENLSILTPIDSLELGTSHQFTARFLNNIGVEEAAAIDWSSSDENILSINTEGLATGLAEGEVEVKAELNRNDGPLLSDSFRLVVVDEEVTIVEPQSRNGSLRTTSSYRLAGDFVLEENDGALTLRFASNYVASSSLPGLYVYLTNNPNTISNAFEIGMATSFSGAHEYEITGDVDLTQYNYVLFFCKPFGVKVGDGQIN